jgi:hypothetical protein
MRQAKSASDKDGRLYDSRRGIASYYRYGPRDITKLCNQTVAGNPDRNVQIALPKIHHTVFERIKTGAHPYAPIGLPASYAVVEEDGRIVHCDVAGYEPLKQPVLRVRHQEMIWDLVAQRRFAYFGTIASTAFLILYPLFHVTPQIAEYNSPLRPISDLIRLIGAFIPTDLASFWIDQYARDPFWLIVGVVSLVFFLVLSAKLESKIADGMRLVWKQSMSGTLTPPPIDRTWTHCLRGNPAYTALSRLLRTKLLPLGSFVLLLYLVLTFTSHFAFNFFDAAGYVCAESSNPSSLVSLQPGKYADIEFKTSALCQSTKVRVVQNARYVIKFDSTDSFRDGEIDAARSFASSDLPDWTSRTIMTLATPLRREWLRPWFRVVARYGGSGSEESFLDPDFTDRYWIDSPIVPTRDGELFLFVNDAVIGIPGLFGVFYRNNQGSTHVRITRTK